MSFASGEVALADTVIVAGVTYLALFAGAVRLTVGGVLTALTVMLRGTEVVSVPKLSVTFAVRL